MTKIRVELPKGWKDYSREYSDGPATFLRELSDVPGPLQISCILYRGGAVPNTSESDLIRLSKDLGEEEEFGELLETDSGFCFFGKFGTAVFRSFESPRVQVWHLSNGIDFILATHICPEEPDPIEVEEVQEIVKTATSDALNTKGKSW